MKKKTKNNKKSSRKGKTYRKRTGGAIDCEAEGFDLRIREAGFGREYPTAIVSHEESEGWSYEQLVDISTRGLVGWYCKQAKLTPSECGEITSIPEVQILGAFFHRYKVFSEHIARTKNALIKNLKGRVGPPLETVLERLYAKFTDTEKRDYDFVGTYLPTGENFEKFRTMDIPIERTIDRVQCLLWVIVKNKGLPDGFVMDEKIKKRAMEPIILKQGINDYPYSIKMTPYAPIVVEKIAKLIRIVETDFTELDDVTFGVY
jgi:hypothetical protein